MARYLTNHMDALKELLKNKRLSLFLNYDGTLTPIVGRPEAACLPFFMRELLQDLRRYYNITIISGRSIDDLMKRVKVDGIVYSGNHGLEIWSKDFKFEWEAKGIKLKETLEKIAKELGCSLAKIQGILIENKGLTASIHYRLTDSRDNRSISSIVRAVLSSYIEKGIFILSEGKKVFEIRPNVPWNKGRAVEWILDQKGFRDTLPLYIGDDETDRDAFKVLKGRGITIEVGGKWIEADYFLEFQREVKGFLEWLSNLPFSHHLQG